VTLSQGNIRSIGHKIVSDMGDVFYQPWEHGYTGPIPEGPDGKPVSDKWDKRAVDAWWDRRYEDMGAAAVGALSDKLQIVLDALLYARKCNKVVGRNKKVRKAVLILERLTAKEAGHA